MAEPRNPCPPERHIERPRFFEGQMLTASDLRAEQEYMLDRFNTHNWLHGWGTVCGLAVEPTDPPSGKVVVGPGVAVDCCGRQIVVTEPIDLDVLEKAVQLQGRPTVFVTLEYHYEGVAFVAVPGGPDTSDKKASRIREVPRVRIALQPPEREGVPLLSDGIVPCPPCDDPAITLARIELGQPGPITAPAIDNGVRRYVAPGTTAGATTTDTAAIERLERRTAILASVMGFLAGAVGAYGVLSRKTRIAR